MREQPPGTRNCPVCEEDKPLAAFKHTGKYCRRCYSAMRRRKKNPPPPLTDEELRRLHALGRLIANTD